MGKPTGFLEFEREEGKNIDPIERLEGFEEFHKLLPKEKQEKQGARCMDCGIPFCQSGILINGMVSGCPINNLIPEWNDLIYRGKWKLALKPEPPKVRSGKKVAVIGSGPAGLATADSLNKRGHNVVVFERHDRIGGLLMYGIPNMKLDKSVIDRRVNLMKEEGVEFVTNANVGDDYRAEDILNNFDAVVLATGASNPRDLKAPGRELNGVHFAVDFLRANTKSLLDSNLSDGNFISAKDKNVIVIGGGDTGTDCVGTSLRHGCKSLVQFEIMNKPPLERADNNPWPQWPRILKVDYGQQEFEAKYGEDPRKYAINVKSFEGDSEGNLTKVNTVDVKWEKNDKGAFVPVEVPGSEKEWKAELVLLAMGFLGTQDYVSNAFGVELDARTNVKAGYGNFRTNVDKVFAAGDSRRGQSLVVWAINEGRAVAKEVDSYLAE